MTGSRSSVAPEAEEADVVTMRRTRSLMWFLVAAGMLREDSRAA